MVFTRRFNDGGFTSVAYTGPEVAWVGLTEDLARQQGIKVKKGLFPWAASGRPLPTAGMDASPSCCLTTHRRVQSMTRRGVLSLCHCAAWVTMSTLT